MRDPEDHAVGDLIAEKYRLVRLLSRGGMGAVWVAHNELLDIQVALKLIRHDLRGDFLAARLLTEARIAARLDHPAVVTVYDVGNTEAGEPYIVMELLRGEDLRDLLERESCIDPARAVQMLLPIADGLHAAHLDGVVHRDLKPENIYFSQNDGRIRPKIVDFGIAKHAESACGRCITRSGAVVGSPDYMSPEQARAEDVDQRADVWGFCVVLYECIVGQPPFADSSYDRLLNDIIEKPAPPIAAFGVCDEVLWGILAKGLSKDRNARWQSMRELGRALAEWLCLGGVEEDICGHSLRATWLRDSRDAQIRAQRSTPESHDVVELPASVVEEVMVDEGVVLRDAPAAPLNQTGGAASAHAPSQTPTPTSWFRPELRSSAVARLPSSAASHAAHSRLGRSVRAIAVATTLMVGFVAAGLIVSVSFGADFAPMPAKAPKLGAGLIGAAKAQAARWFAAEAASDRAPEGAGLARSVAASAHEQTALPRSAVWPSRARRKAAVPLSRAAAESAAAGPFEPASPSPRRTRAGVLIDADLGF